MSTLKKKAPPSARGSQARSPDVDQIVDDDGDILDVDEAAQPAPLSADVEEKEGGDQAMEDTPVPARAENGREEVDVEDDADVDDATVGLWDE